MPHNKNLSRRDALKTLAAATGAVALTTLPGQWDTPVVQVGALPAHAQGSIDDLRVIFTVSSLCQDGECGGVEGDGEDGEYHDFDAHIGTPDENYIYVWDDPHQGVNPTTPDNVDPNPNSNTEAFVIPAGQAANGCYQIHVDCYYDNTVISVTIITPAGSRTFTRTISVDSEDEGTDWYVAEVCYPGGIITELGDLEPFEVSGVSAQDKKAKRH